MLFIIFASMNEDFKETKDFLQHLSDKIHVLIRDIMPDGMILFTQILAKILLLALLLTILNFIFKQSVRLGYKLVKKHSEKPILKSLYETKVLYSLSNLFSVGITKSMITSVFYRHPKSHVFLDTIFELIFVAVFAFLYIRVLKAVERYYLLKGDLSRITGIRAVTQTLKVIGYVLFIFIGISLLFQITLGTIFKSLGAMTALILLIFRDTVLGFITGLHVTATKNVKVGDWVGIPKYNIEGTIEDINILTTKIINFDKTVSTIPTYDLLSTEIKNLQIMSESNTRRIKKSIIFNVRSFKFIDQSMFNRLEKINLIKDYMAEMRPNVNLAGEENDEDMINGRQLTNIGTFRIYALNYLKNNPKIDQRGSLMVRQLEITPQGLPLEIYCFANSSQWTNYEQIQADIFDHLLVAAQKFDLDVMQTSAPK